MRHAVAHLITDRSLFSAYFLGEFPRDAGKSFIGVFGWANVLMPQLAYRPTSRSSRIGPRRRGAGAVAASARLAARRGARASPCLGALAVVVRINLQFTQPQGRYLLPGLPAFAVLIALGLRIAAGGAARASTSPAVVGVALLAGNLYALVGVVLPGLPSSARAHARHRRARDGPEPPDRHGRARRRQPLGRDRPQPRSGWHTSRRPRTGSRPSRSSSPRRSTPAPQRACVYYASTDRPMHGEPAGVRRLAGRRPAARRTRAAARPARLGARGQPPAAEPVRRRHRRPRRRGVDAEPTTGAVGLAPSYRVGHVRRWSAHRLRVAAPAVAAIGRSGPGPRGCSGSHAMRVRRPRAGRYRPRRRGAPSAW